MHKAVVAVFSLIGVAAGVLAASENGIGLSVLFGGIGAVAGMAIGASFAGIARPRSPPKFRWEPDDEPVVERRVQDQNYWLDRGRLTAAPGLPHADDIDPHSHEP